VLVTTGKKKLQFSKFITKKLKNNRKRGIKEKNYGNMNVEYLQTSFKNRSSLCKCLYALKHEHLHTYATFKKFTLAETNTHTRPRMSSRPILLIKVVF
jgi:hypothetical protein